MTSYPFCSSVGEHPLGCYIPSTCGCPPEGLSIFPQSWKKPPKSGTLETRAASFRWTPSTAVSELRMRGENRMASHDAFCRSNMGAQNASASVFRVAAALDVKGRQV